MYKENFKCCLTCKYCEDLDKEGYEHECNLWCYKGIVRPKTWYCSMYKASLNPLQVMMVRVNNENFG